MVEETEDQLLIYDFNAIVASVGGSLGLFLGFSCWDFIDPVIDKFRAIFRNHKM